MVLKATNNGLSVANAEQSKGAGRRTHKKGSRVTQARAKAQRAKLDKEADARQQPEGEHTASQTTQNKRAIRQDLQAKRRVIETLIEAYIQDHIGGNHSVKRYAIALSSGSSMIPASASLNSSICVWAILIANTGS